MEKETERCDNCAYNFRCDLYVGGQQVACISFEKKNIGRS